MDKAAWMAHVRASREAPRRVGRGAAPKYRLLDDGDPNIGNGAVISAYPNPDATVAVTRPLTNPTRLLALDALSPTAQTVTIGLTASGIVDTEFGANFPTPITGIIEIGNGSVFTRVEVDIPVGRYNLSTVGETPEQPQDGVVFVTVPAGTLRVYARNDSKYIVPNALGQVGTPDLAPGQILPPVSGRAGDAFVKAFCTYYSVRGHNNAPTRTYYIGKAPAGGLTFSSTITEMYAIPPLAKRFRVLRSVGAPTTMVAFSGDIFDANIQRIDSFSTPLNVSSPWFDLPGVATFIGLNMVTTEDTIAALVFEIGV